MNQLSINPKYEKLVKICYPLSVFVSEMRRMSAALRAHQNIMSKEDNPNCFLDIAHDAICRELLSEIAKIFDPGNDRSNENCSLLRLKNECLKDSYVDLFPAGKNDTYVKLIDIAYQRYGKLPVKKSRNNQLSHHDMKQTFGDEPIVIFFDEIEKLVFLITEILSVIYEHINFAELTFPPYDYLVKSYEHALKSLVDQ